MKPCRRLIAVLPLILSFLSLPGASARAASGPDVLPPFQIPLREEAEKMREHIDAVKPGEAGFSNPYLEETVALQYQISLLELLVQRQTSIVRLQKAYGELGRPFAGPPPARGICAQLPPNAPCAQHYPELYRAGLEAAGFPEIDLEALKEEQPPLVEPVAMPAPPPEAAASDFAWTDIMCAAGVCRAVVTASGNPKSRLSVREGDILPDGSKIVRIGYALVAAEKGGQQIKLLPADAPSKGGSASPLFGTVSGAQANASPNAAHLEVNELR